MHTNLELRQMSRCTPACTYGHCKILAEAWFTRILSLERKRTERSGSPFILVLMNLEGLGRLNGNQDRLVHDITGLASFTRETDTAGWYREGSILGILFTELGECRDMKVAVTAIKSKIVRVLDERVGTEMSSCIKISCHVFPEERNGEKTDGRIDTRLYPDLEPTRQKAWLSSNGKRAIDIALSLLALVGLSPVFLVVAVAVKLSSKGPVFYQQDRVGQFGKRFKFLKFRSMRVCNQPTIHEQYVRKLIRRELKNPEDGIFKLQNDPRVTAVGRFLRRASLDEMPQFWNVLMGHMSLVGPRPPLPYEVRHYDLWHRSRLLEAKPGITGLWQVTGRSRTCFDDMVRLDLQYSRHSSLWLDLRILMKTPAAVIAGSGAY